MDDDAIPLDNVIGSAPDTFTPTGNATEPESLFSSSVGIIERSNRSNRNGAWPGRALLICVGVVVFVFLVSLHLDMDLPGTWWNVFVPLFVVQGVFAALCLLYMLAIKFDFRHRMHSSLTIVVPDESTFAQFLVELILLMALYSSESLICAKLQDEDAFDWTWAFFPLYVASTAIFIYYGLAYLQVAWFVNAQHFKDHPVTRRDALTRGVANLLVLAFMILLDLWLEHELDWPLWVVFLPLYGAAIFAGIWAYRYVSDGVVRVITMFELGLALLTIAVLVIGSVFFFLKIDGTLEWSWFATLSPLMLGLLIIIAVLSAGLYLKRRMLQDAVVTVDDQGRNVVKYDSDSDEDNAMDDI